MKSFAAVVLALSGAAVAQQFPDGFPECGRTCVNNMLAKAAEFNCASTDAACLCRAQNFRWGINDCAWQACQQNQQEYNTIVRFGSEWCANAGAPSNIPPTVIGGGATTVEPTNSDGQNPTATGGTSETTSGDASALTTETWTSTFTTDGTQAVVTGTTTYSGVSGVTGASSLPETTVTTNIVSTVTDATTTFETTIPSTFTTIPTGSELTSALESQATDAATSTSTSRAWGAQVTAPPALGLFAAAGIAAALL